MCFNVARMFVQVTKCKHGSVTYFTYLVRESFRTPKGPRSRTICNITALPPETRELISQSLQGRSFVAAESLQLSEAWNCGGLMVLHQAWEEFGLSTIFDFVADARMAGLLKAMTLGRILFPSAKLALVDHARGTLLAAACGLDQATEDFDEDDLYAAMDQLNGHWVGIEKQLYQKSFHQRDALGKALLVELLLDADPVSVQLIHGGIQVVLVEVFGGLLQATGRGQQGAASVIDQGQFGAGKQNTTQGHGLEQTGHPSIRNEVKDRAQAKLLPGLVQDHQPAEIPGFGQLERLCGHKA